MLATLVTHASIPSISRWSDDISANRAALVLSLGLAFGVLTMLFGWRMFRALFAVGFGAAGFISGLLLDLGAGTAILFGMLCCLAGTFVALRLERYAVAFVMTCVTAGAALTFTVWLGLDTPWPGIIAAAGATVTAVVTYLRHRFVVALWSSLSGAQVAVNALVLLSALRWPARPPQPGPWVEALMVLILAVPAAAFQMCSMRAAAMRSSAPTSETSRTVEPAKVPAPGAPRRAANRRTPTPAGLRRRAA
jgi:hypothetical protein